jgi:hypothetical protein
MDMDKVFLLTRWAEPVDYESPSYPEVFGVASTKQDALILFAMHIHTEIQKRITDPKSYIRKVKEILPGSEEGTFLFKYGMFENDKVSFKINMNHWTVEAIMDVVMEKESLDIYPILELLETKCVTEYVASADIPLKRVLSERIFRVDYYGQYVTTAYSIKEFDVNSYTEAQNLTTNKG